MSEAIESRIPDLYGEPPKLGAEVLRLEWATKEEAMRQGGWACRRRVTTGHCPYVANDFARRWWHLGWWQEESDGTLASNDEDD